MPLLYESDDYVAARSSTDGMCDQTLVCEEGTCRDVGLSARCGSNGKACDEGLVCVQPYSGFQVPPQLCFEAGSVGDGCDYFVDTRSVVSGDGTQLKGCGGALLFAVPLHRY